MLSCGSGFGVLVLALGLTLPAAAAAQDVPPPRILLDQSPRAVDYQLRRLSDEDLARVERRADDPRYVPVYYALLTRPMMTDVVREEAITALIALEKTTRVGVLLGALGRVEAAAAADPLLRQLLAQPVEDLTASRDHLATVGAADDALPFARQGALVASILAGSDPQAVWEAAGATDGRRATLLRGLAFLPAGAAADEVRRRLAPLVEAAIAAAADDEEYLAAIDALPQVRRDDGAFEALARQVIDPRVPEGALHAFSAMGRLPESARARASAIDPVVQAVIGHIGAMSPDDRATPAAIDALGLADRLAAALPVDRARAVRAELRALGVRVVRLEALFEQVVFDLRWFVVEAGKPVQIVFFNPDAMPHNVVVGAPGSLERIGTEGGAMPMPADPAVKPFVPNLPEVLFATGLVARGNTERLGFIAPAQPGEYVFVCTFPGHWVRMYGVMLVVPNLAAWESAPTVPTDPMTKQPFASQRME